MELNKKGTYVHIPRMTLPIEEFKNMMIQHILCGSSRARLIQKIHRSYSRMRPELVSAHRHAWLRDIVDKLLNKRPYAESMGSLALYQLWNRVSAVDEEWNWLGEIRWYRRPTRDEIREDDHSNGRMLNQLRASSEASTRMREASTRDPRKRMESPEIRTRSLTVIPPQDIQGSSSSRFDVAPYIPEQMYCSPSPEQPMSKKMRKFIEEGARPLVVAMDIEGQKPDYLEIAAIVADDKEWISAKIWYLRPKSVGKVIAQARFCNGISPVELVRMKCSTLEEIKTELAQWLTSFHRPMIILSADENPDSDVKELTGYLKYPYLNICLPRWEHRIDTHAHRKVQEMKKARFQIAEVTCPYSVIHSIPLVETGKPNIESGPHCGFFDSIEILLHIEFNQLWHLIFRLHHSERKTLEPI